MLTNIFAQQKNYVFTKRTSENEFNFIWEQFNKEKSHVVRQDWFFANNIWTCTKININRDDSTRSIDKVTDQYQLEIRFYKDNRLFSVPHQAFSKVNLDKVLLFDYSNYLETNKAIFENMYQLSEAIHYVSLIKYAERATFYFVNAFNVTKSDKYNEVHQVDYSYAKQYQLTDDPYVLYKNDDMLAVTSLGVCRSNRR